MSGVEGPTSRGKVCGDTYMLIDQLMLAGATPADTSIASITSATSSTAGETSTAANNLKPGQPAMPWTEAVQATQSSFHGMLTAGMIRDELMTMGIETSNTNVAIAQSLAKLGIPLTTQIMSEAQTSLAATAGANPAAFAMSRLLGLPASPTILRGLSAVMTSNASASGAQPGVVSLLQSFLPTALAAPAAVPIDPVTRPGEIVNRPNLPAELLQRLGLTLSPAATAEEITNVLRVFARQLLRSTENRILTAMEDGVDLIEVDDLRVVLIKLATDAPDPGIRDAAAALASNIEGQQLINAANLGAPGAAHEAALASLGGVTPGTTHNGDSQSPIYFSLPLLYQGEPSTIELRMWPRDQHRNGETWVDEDAYPIRATVRLTLSQLGRVQIDVIGDLNGYLHCQFSAERPAVGRLIARSADQLSDILAAAGWARNEVTFNPHTDWAPLWTGGKALTRPRQRIDWRA